MQLTLVVVAIALLVSSATAQSCATASATTCGTCFSAGCSWSPVSVTANGVLSSNGQCLSSSQSGSSATAAYAAFVTSSQFCGLANCVGALAVSLSNTASSTQDKCNAASTFFSCATSNFCNTNAAICTQAYVNGFCSSFWAGFQCSGSCPFSINGNGGTTTSSTTTAPKTLPPASACFVSSLFSALSTWNWNPTTISTSAITWFANFRACLATAAANYIANTATITCDNFQTALNNALTSCGNNAGGISVCSLSGSDIQAFLTSNPLGNSTQVVTNVRLALQNCPASKYTETKFTFQGLTVAQVQSAAVSIVNRICSILNINPCNKVTFVAAVSGSVKRQSSATAVVAISADQGTDASVQAVTVVAQQSQVAQAAGTTAVAASTCSGTCAVSPASLASATPFLIAAAVVLALLL